jgi:ribosome biogenesis GTPase A
MEIQWFAGHMVRAKRIIKEKLRIIDIVLELIDARLPLSSRSPFIADVLRNKPGFLILNKTDLADPALTKLWVEWFANQGMTVITCESVRGGGIGEVFKEISRLERAEGGRQGTKITGVPRCMVVGIPNVGKSMFINRLAGKKATRAGRLPGLTRGEQWIRIGDKMELLDTPGVLWPKLEDQEVAVKLAATGAIKEELYDAEQVAAWLLGWLIENKRKELAERYGLGGEFLEIASLLELIGRKRGFLTSGGLVDRYRTSLHILKDFRTGRLGRCTLENPPEYRNNL